jgi:hypothetical protein
MTEPEPPKPGNFFAGSSPWLDVLKNHPLLWALPVQALLLFSNLDLLEPWRDEWFTLKTVPQSIDRIRVLTEQVAHPPVYFFLLHYWLRLPFPHDELWKLRAMSVLWALLATIVIDRLRLREESPGARCMVLALWVLSPCMLLYARMARSYSMQLAFAVIAIAAAIRWMDRPRSLPRLLAYSILATLLLYIHYLPGLAIVAAVALVFALRPQPRAATRVTLLGLMLLAIVMPFSWELRPIADAIGQWRFSDAVSIPGLIVDQLIRLSWWFVSFSFGESISTPVIVLGALLSPIVLYALFRGAAGRPRWLVVAALAALFGYVGVTGWTSFPFTPARMLFLLPFFLLLLVKGLRTMRYGSAIVGAFVLTYAIADYSYFARSGFLNKEYCIPYTEMASAMNRGTSSGSAVLLVDEYSTFSSPLIARLSPRVRVISLEDEDTAADLAARQDWPDTIWMLRHSHDTSPHHWVSDLEDHLREGRIVTETGYLPYSKTERWILTMLRGPDQPRDFYVLSRFIGRPDQRSSAGKPQPRTVR